MSEIRKVLIVGGGIGGLTAAVALRQQGIAAEIVEINAAWSVYGVGIIQPSNMLRALAQIGLGQQCLALAFEQLEQFPATLASSAVSQLFQALGQFSRSRLSENPEVALKTMCSAAKCLRVGAAQGVSHLIEQQRCVLPQ